ELANRIVISRVRVDPARMYLGLVDGFLQVYLNSRDKSRELFRRTRFQRPGTDERLIEQILIVRIGSHEGFQLDPVRLIPEEPAASRGTPFVGYFGKNIEASPDILAALGVVGRGGR